MTKECVVNTRSLLKWKLYKIFYYILCRPQGGPTQIKHCMKWNENWYNIYEKCDLVIKLNFNQIFSNLFRSVGSRAFIQV